MKHGSYGRLPGNNNKRNYWSAEYRLYETRIGSGAACQYVRILGMCATRERGVPLAQTDTR